MHYRASGGDILATPRHVLSCDDAEALLDVHRDELRAAARARDPVARRRARTLVLELAGALCLARRWRRASGLIRWT